MEIVSGLYSKKCPRNEQKSIFPDFQGHLVTLNQGQGHRPWYAVEDPALDYHSSKFGYSSVISV